MKPLVSLLPDIAASVLVAHGDLDVWNHPAEGEAIAARMKKLDRPYRHLRFRDLGHSLSRSIDYFKEDGGLTIHDNPTLNAPTRRTLRRLERSIKELLSAAGG